jgi:hypothetical protein
MNPENRNPPRRAPEANASEERPRPASTLEAASFIENMTAELRGIAQEAKLDALGYFLEMARIEASGEVVRIARANGTLGNPEATDHA